MIATIYWAITTCQACMSSLNPHNTRTRWAKELVQGTPFVSKLGLSLASRAQANYMTHLCSLAETLSTPTDNVYYSMLPVSPGEEEATSLELQSGKIQFEWNHILHRHGSLILKSFSPSAGPKSLSRGQHSRWPLTMRTPPRELRSLWEAQKRGMSNSKSFRSSEEGQG